MTAPLYFTIAVIVGLFMVVWSTWLTIRNSKPDAFEGSTSKDAAINAGLITVVSACIGLGWIVLFPLTIIGHIVYWVIKSTNKK